MACITCHLSNDDCRAWGFPYLMKTKTTYTYCECGDCEGHGTTVDLPECEWYWRPRHQRVDMGDIYKLENDKSPLMEFVSQLGKP